MHLVFAWFSVRPIPPDERAAIRARFDAGVESLVPPGYGRQDRGGDDWGVTVLHPVDLGGYRWPIVAEDATVSVVSMGLPVGLDTAAGPVALGRRLLAGQDIHADVVPPFAMLALDGDREMALQQDWLGMARVFTGERDGVTAFCTRPSLLAHALHGTARPDAAGWASYAVCGHFGGATSPIEGVRLLSGGTRVTGHRRDGGWRLKTERRRGMDEVVSAGSRSVDAALDHAAESFAGTAASIARLYEDEITLGLSGGKDSRLIAASFIATGHLPRFATNEDMAAEGEMARRLLEIVRDKRGLAPEHRCVRSGNPVSVLAVGLDERISRMQRLTDFQFPSSYAVRPALPPRMPNRARPASLTGAGGELAVGYWYPRDDGNDLDRTAAEREARKHLFSGLAEGEAAAPAWALERNRLTDLLDHASGLGLRGMEMVDYVYLAERARRWYTSAYYPGMVTPFLAPAVVSATFALSTRQKRERVLHAGLIERLMPEWSGIPFVSASSGSTRATHLWEGDGIQVICGLLDTVRDGLPELMNLDVVEARLASAAAGDPVGGLQRVLQQYATLAIASRTLEPDLVRPSTRDTYRRITATDRGAPPDVPPVLARMVAPMRFIKRSSTGRRVWAAVRERVVRR